MLIFTAFRLHQSDEAFLGFGLKAQGAKQQRYSRIYSNMGGVAVSSINIKFPEADH
jgi:hypothetical protein